MKSLVIDLTEQAVQSLIDSGALAIQPTPPVVVTPTKDASHGDLATNIALVMAKSAGMNPRELAQQIVEAIPENSSVSRVEIAGPGFINFFVASDHLAHGVADMLGDPRLGVETAQPVERVVIDYSSPNLAKEMHVGHLRTTIIGDALVRVMEFLGHDVIRQNHVGDWGTQFGMLLAFLAERRAAGEQPGHALADLEDFYQRAKLRFDESPDFAERARETVVELQAGNQQHLAAWSEYIDVSLEHAQAVYERLGVLLEPADVRAESAYNEQLQPIVSELESQGLLTTDAGAGVVFVPAMKGRDGEPLAVIVRKKDGGFLYATTDLAAIRYRVEALNADRLIYVVDKRQGDHFRQVFEVARMAGWVPDSVRLEHVGYGTVNGKDGKPFKTRSGGGVKLDGLLDEAIRRAESLVREKNSALEHHEAQHIARVVGIASVKYADLSKNRNSDYQFDWDQMLSFEGNTAPYLLYAVTRIKSLLHKAGALPAKATVVLEHPLEQKLAQHLLTYPEVVEKVAERCLPHLLCTWLYELAGLYSSFYEACPVLSADSNEIRDSRLNLSRVSHDCMENGLAHLGIETLERM